MSRPRKPRKTHVAICQYPCCGIEFETSTTGKFCQEHRKQRELERMRDYRARHKDDAIYQKRRRAHWQKYRAAHLEHEQARANAWKKANPERCAEIKRAWFQRNKKRLNVQRLAKVHPDNPIFGMAVLEREMMLCPRMHVRHRKELCGTREYCRGCEMCPTGFGKPQFKLGVAI